MNTRRKIEKGAAGCVGDICRLGRGPAGTGEGQLTNPPRMNGFPTWGEVRTRTTGK